MCIMALKWWLLLLLMSIVEGSILYVHACVCVTDRLWDVDCGSCLRILEGHEELVRCIRFDHKRIISGAYDG